GVVVFSSRHKSYGICVIVRQLDGRLARYAHMSKSVARFGDEVTRGTVIGYVGRTGRATGSHLHFELLDDGEYLDPAEHIWLATELVKTPQELAMEEAEREALAANEKTAAETVGTQQTVE
ncbi:M23 family metallopeptidase, partial [Desulfovibrio sp. OttesenSCG-928-I05]|nr:M23 family metallopeptidase [Desulfovibrio sp. OttesenSCG-928-I05]